MRRYFVAYYPPKTVRGAIGKVISQFKAGNAKDIVPSNYHMTIAYFGTLDEHQLAVLRQSLQESQLPPIEVQLSKLDYFAKAKTLWLGLAQPNAKLVQSATNIRATLLKTGLTFDQKAFAPHVTVKKKWVGAPPKVGLFSIPWKINEYCLMSSDSKQPSGEYEIIAKFTMKLGA